MSVFPPLCPLSVCDTCDAILAAQTHICPESQVAVAQLAGPPPTPIVSMTSFDIFYWFWSVLLDITQHSCQLCFWYKWHHEANLLICQSCLHTQCNPMKTSRNIKGQKCCNNDTMQLLHSFFLPLYCFCCSPNGAECEITAEKHRHLFSLFACNCVL